MTPSRSDNVCPICGMEDCSAGDNGMDCLAGIRESNVNTIRKIEESSKDKPREWWVIKAMLWEPDPRVVCAVSDWIRERSGLAVSDAYRTLAGKSNDELEAIYYSGNKKWQARE